MVAHGEHQAHVVVDEQDRQVEVEQRPQALAQDEALGAVEPGGRLVEQQHAGPLGQRPGHRHQLALPEGQLGRTAIGHARSPSSSSASPTASTSTARRGSTTSRTIDAESLGHRRHLAVLAHGQVVEQLERLPRAHQAAAGPLVRRPGSSMRSSARRSPSSRSRMAPWWATNPVSASMVVVLPAPLGPISPTRLRVGDRERHPVDRDHAAEADHEVGRLEQHGVATRPERTAWSPAGRRLAAPGRVSPCSRLASPHSAATVPRPIITTLRPVGGRSSSPSSGSPRPRTSASAGARPRARHRRRARARAADRHRGASGQHRPGRSSGRGRPRGLAAPSRFARPTSETAQAERQSGPMKLWSVVRPRRQGSPTRGLHSLQRIATCLRVLGASWPFVAPPPPPFRGGGARPAPVERVRQRSAWSARRRRARGGRSRRSADRRRRSCVVVVDDADRVRRRRRVVRDGRVVRRGRVVRSGGVVGRPAARCAAAKASSWAREKSCGETVPRISVASKVSIAPSSCSISSRDRAGGLVEAEPGLRPVGQHRRRSVLDQLEAVGPVAHGPVERGRVGEVGASWSRTDCCTVVLEGRRVGRPGCSGRCRRPRSSSVTILPSTVPVMPPNCRRIESGGRWATRALEVSVRPGVEPAGEVGLHHVGALEAALVGGEELGRRVGAGHLRHPAVEGAAEHEGERPPPIRRRPRRRHRAPLSEIRAPGRR